MQHRYLGNSGLKVSEIIYGNWLTHATQIENQKAIATVHAALDGGITSFDTADVYANQAAETVLGVYSTALVEALALRCRVGVFNLPGIEHIEPIIARGDAKLLKSPKDFDALMAQPLPVDNSTANYYYDEPVDLHAMIKEMYV